jgi:membrane protease subunit HflC
VKSPVNIALAIAAALLLTVVFGSGFVVREDQQVILTQFGEPVGQPVREPGLHFKLPLVQRAHYFEKRFIEWRGNAEELPTRDKVFIFVDTYARWRISDPLLFFQRLRDESGAQSRLDDILDGETRSAIAKHTLREVIRSANRTPIVDEDAREDSTEFAEVSMGRERIREEILRAAQGRTADLGIEVLDVQFKRINYGDQVQGDVFNRMISERRRIADRYRSEGQGEASRIRGEMERELKRIQSDAYRQAQEIRGRSDAEASEIYAKAYDQAAESRDFYEFLKSLESLERTFDRDTWLVLSTDGDLYRYLKRANPGPER